MTHNEKVTKLNEYNDYHYFCTIFDGKNDCNCCKKTTDSWNELLNVEPKYVLASSQRPTKIVKSILICNDCLKIFENIKLELRKLKLNRIND